MAGDAMDETLDWFFANDYGVTMTIASDLSDPTSVHAANHALTIWGYEEYDGVITDLWVTDSDDLAAELFRLQVQDMDGLLYLSGGELTATYGYPMSNEWYIKELHALKKKNDLLKITTSISDSGTGGGSISPISPQVPPHTEQIAFTIVPDIGSTLAQLRVGEVDEIESCQPNPTTGTFEYILNIGATNHTIEAVFNTVDGTATIDVDPGTNGRILYNGSPVTGDVFVAKGTDHSFTIEPDDGYTLATLLINGEESWDCPTNEDCKYTFTNVAADTHTIAATIQSEDELFTITAWAYEKITGQVFGDSNGNGVPDEDEELAGVQVVITDRRGHPQTLTTNEKGKYAANVVIGQVTGHLFEDSNDNGEQDPGEPDLPDVQVVIRDSLGNEQTLTTDAAGNYRQTAYGGSISPAGNVKVLKGEAAPTFTMTRADKYQFVDVFVKKYAEKIWRSVSEAISADPDDLVREYTFPEAVNEDWDIKVRFANKKDTLLKLKAQCYGPYRQKWECTEITSVETGEYVARSIPIGIDGEPYEFVIGFWVSLSEAEALFLEYEGQAANSYGTFQHWEYCEDVERELGEINGEIVYITDRECISAALSFGEGCDSH